MTQKILFTAKINFHAIRSLWRRSHYYLKKRSQSKQDIWLIRMTAPNIEEFFLYIKL